MSVRIEAESEPIPGYKLLDRLGSGGFGEVWRCEAPGGIFKAVKIIFGDLRSNNTDVMRYAEQELKSLKRVKQVRHPYLLALDRFDIVEGRLLIVMELADCNLWDRFRACRDKGLPGIPRDELLMYMAETAEVLDLMNDQHQLQHLDIKPQNLFMLHNHVKVADFGQVKDLQGVLASVTGGITPVYAAPETFDGVVSRYCDQYSLACVYQELLTGQRPFDGTSMSQLLMQHIQLPPDLAPSPPCDRPVLTRALAKKADDRWPNVGVFVRALRDAGDAALAASRSGESRLPAGEPVAIVEPPRDSPSHGGVAALSLETPFPRAMDETESHQPLFTPAPVEIAGDGPLRPALIIGIGLSGLRILQRFRFDLTERHGPPEYTPLVRTLFIDTDAETLDDAVKGRAKERLAALHPDAIFSAKLNRSGHYMKPRVNGRSLIDGWFDTQLLYRIPRVPQTMGVRSLGRLALCDHFRPLSAAIRAELEACVSPDALHLTEQRTGLRRRTNRPRVYIVAGLAGGTGGGMFLDLAYAVRGRLQRMGYENPDVIGVLVVPPADAAITPPIALGNTYAALTELNHFSHPDTTFSAQYDDRTGLHQEKAPPFSRCYLVPSSAAGPTPTRASPPGSGVHPALRSVAPATIGAPGSRARSPGSGATQPPGSRAEYLAEASQAAFEPYADAAEFLRLELFTPIGRAADDAREAMLEDVLTTGVQIGAFGIRAFEWPRAEVVSRTSALVARTVLKNWVASNVKRAREVVPPWAAAQWGQFGLDPERVLEIVQSAMERTAGGQVEELIANATEPIVPKAGWRVRLPDAQKIQGAIEWAIAHFGPAASPAKREPTEGEVAMRAAAAAVAKDFTAALGGFGQSLVEDPRFRFSGAEDVLRQFLATTDRLAETYAHGLADADARAIASYECLARYALYHHVMKKVNGAEIVDAMRQFPRARYRAVTCRLMIDIYRVVRESLAAQLANVTEARMRLEAAGSDPAPDAADAIAGPRRLMPAGCLGVADAVRRFLDVLSDADLAEIDRRIQAVLEPERGGLYQACFQSGTGADGIFRMLREEARAFLDGRLGEVDLGAMFAERFRSRPLAEQGVAKAFAEAQPDWIGHGPWAASEVVVTTAPAGSAGASVRELLARAIPVAGLTVAESHDDVTIYREYPAVPLAAVPHLSPACAMAYRTIPESATLHSRIDIAAWAEVGAV